MSHAQAKTWGCDAGYVGSCSAACNNGNFQATNNSCTGSGTWTAGNWSACSATCGNGTQTRSYTCTGGVCSSPQPANDSQTCNVGACITCPGTTVQTGNSKFKCAVDPVKSTPGQTYTLHEIGVCNYTDPCPCTMTVTCKANGTWKVDSKSWGVPAPTTGAWSTGGWSACSQTCGGGVQTRSVTCSFTTCTGVKPATSQTCNTQACATTGAWSTGGWSACSKTCGGGVQTRSVTCSFTTCTGVKPASSQTCNTQACATSGAWSIGGWSACSKTCGGGVQTRSVTCSFTTCTGSKPASSQTCNTQACATSGTWSTGGWGSCSKTCGGGVKTRSVTCSFTTCTGSKPAASQTCNTQACATSGAWSTGGWSACSKTCGGGVKTRSVTCSFTTCTGSKPAASQTCNTGACTTYAWAAVQGQCITLGSKSSRTYWHDCSATPGGIVSDSLCPQPKPANYDVDCHGGTGENGGGGGCFLPETFITMADGTLKPIIEIAVGEKVKGAGNIVNTVLKTITFQHTGKLYALNGSTAFVTGGHPLKTTDGWKAFEVDVAKKLNPDLEITQLKTGDTLITDKGEIELKTVGHKGANNKTVYNLHLDGNQEYYADGFLVHNK
ncbi:MAG: hypothetical protein ACI9TY_001701 [Alphaproteobacteria bacterium]